MLDCDVPQKYASLVRSSSEPQLLFALPIRIPFPAPCVSKVLYFAPFTHFLGFWHVKGALGFGSYCKYFSSCTDGVDSLPFCGEVWRFEVAARVV